MKLRSRINDASKMISLSRVVQSVSKQSKSVIISLKSDRIVLMSDDTTVHKFWCTIKTSALFAHHTVSGAANTDEFRIEMNSGSLSKSLKLVNSSSKSLSVRLGKFSGLPVLNVVIEEPGLNTHKNREISHNINLQIISQRLYHQYDKQQYAVNLLFEVRDMVKFSDCSRKMKALGRGVTITLITTHSTGGREEKTMAVTSNVISCRMRSVFKNIQIAEQAGVQLIDEPFPDPNRIEMHLDSKLLHQFMSAFRRSDLKLIIGIRQDQYATFLVSGTEFEIDFVMPAFTN